MKLPFAFLTFVIACGLSPAMANTVIVSKTVDATVLRPGYYTPYPDVAPYALASGDKLIFQLSFLPGQRLVVSSPTAISAFAWSLDGIFFDTSFVDQFSFTSLSGPAIQPPAASGRSFGGGIVADAVADTFLVGPANASISFTGYTATFFNIQYASPPVTIRSYDGISIMIDGGSFSVVAVPEPGSAPLMFAGIATLAVLMVGSRRKSMLLGRPRRLLKSSST